MESSRTTLNRTRYKTSEAFIGGPQGWDPSFNFHLLLNFGECRFPTKWLHLHRAAAFIHPTSCCCIGTSKRHLLFKTRRSQTNTDSANFAPVRRCCLHAAHYASVMTENVCESHAPLQRKVTLIKLHLMIELIKSVTLFLSLRVRLYGCEGDWSRAFVL